MCYGRRRDVPFIQPYGIPARETSGPRRRKPKEKEKRIDLSCRAVPLRYLKRAGPVAEGGQRAGSYEAGAGSVSSASQMRSASFS